MPSRQRPWTKFMKRGNLKGGEGGDERSSSRRDVAAAFLGRLRRLEVVMLAITGVRKVTDAELDILLGNMLELNDVTPPSASAASASGGSGRSNARSAVRVPQGGRTEGESEEPDGAPV